MTAQEFDWGDLEDVAIVARQQPLTAVYFNPHGQVVIRQAGDHYDDDAFLVFNVEYVRALINALTDCLPEGLPIGRAAGTGAQERAQSTRDRTAASRQQRYRQRRRNGSEIVTRNGAEDVTARNAVTAASVTAEPDLLSREAAE